MFQKGNKCGKGNRGGGRGSVELEVKRATFKNLAWDRIIKQCQKNEEKLDEYIRVFATRLLPQELEDNTPEKLSKLYYTDAEIQQRAIELIERVRKYLEDGRRSEGETEVFERFELPVREDVKLQ